MHVVCITPELPRPYCHLIGSITTKCHSPFSKQAVVVTKVDQSLVVECKAAETISHCEALNIKTHLKRLILVLIQT